ncbi:site-specific integrase [Pseudoalteromonas sp. 2CM28B]|uniref:site-specific integrase n=1 Tax=Pseudoalteromonas sp. 2CM28B TaxID=2929851 RepID=UPI0020BE7B2A|nr:site-specific integrase [Pseudoalteromonas sp. 2CM28B]MCK8136720.1 site-specific integrase [Pseudoalteromonas sp. 2CM28B]
MLLKTQKIKPPAGVVIRYNSKGEATSFQLTFTYKGILCREKAPFIPNKQGLKSAGFFLGQIKNEIAHNTFDYAKYFPKSNKVKLFTTTPNDARVVEYMDLYIARGIDRGLEKSTITGYQKAKNGLKTLWDCKISELESIDVVKLIEKSTVSRKTLSNRISFLRCCLARAVIDKLIKSNPVQNIRIEEYLPKINNIDSRGAHKDVYPFTPQEKAKIIHKSSGTIRAIVSLVFNTGIRSSEWVALKKTDVCLKTKQISIFDAIVDGAVKGTKTKAGRRNIPISEDVCDLLALEMKKHDSEYLFLNSQQRVWNQDSFRKHRWKSLLGSCGVKYRYPYQMRHTFASKLISEGVNHWKISKLMGHSSPNTLYQHYGNFIDEYEREHHA